MQISDIEATQSMDSRLLTRPGNITPSGAQLGSLAQVCCITLHIRGNKICVDRNCIKYDPAASEGLDLAEIVEQFLSGPEEFSLKEDGFLEFFGGGDIGVSQFDVLVEGYSLYLYRIQIDNIFAQDKSIEFLNTDYTKFYRYLGRSADGKRFCFSAKGDSEHKKSLKDNDGHAFNIHCALVGKEHYEDPQDRPITPIVFDPKSRDPGG